MTLLTHFGLGVLLSFIGSIPFGTINVATADTAIRHGLRASLWVAGGAAFVEFFQAVLSLLFSDYLMRYPTVDLALNWAAIPILLGLAYYFYRVDPAPNVKERTQARGFLKGLIVSALNVLAIPYWIFYGSYLSGIGLVDLGDHRCILIFGAGVMCGTFLILLVYAKAGIYASSRSSHVRKYIGRGVALLLAGLALIQTVRMLT